MIEAVDVWAGIVTVFLFGERPSLNRSGRCSLSVSDVMQRMAHTDK